MSCTVASQAPLSVGFPRQEYWSGLPFLSPGDLADPGIEPTSPALPLSHQGSLHIREYRLIRVLQEAEITEQSFGDSTHELISFNDFPKLGNVLGEKILTCPG